ncbi:Hypothetical predicted protein [Mytilus galloprovincialis]|uniref:Tyr recombinase domain-containing protein n=1 Tax=Mytilus galloprovincialis TaxID=29158 RepID=A0A8B6DWC4_MYTGA|nr:Hypothetical predicted protein [Mytilus galloprovincialis]
MSGNWTSNEKLESSRRILCTYESKLSLDNKSVSIDSDNKNVPHILKVGNVNIRRNVEADLVENGVSENCNIYNLAGKDDYIVDSRTGLDAQSEQFIFKPIFRSKGVAKFIYKNKPISYTAAKENVVKRLKLVAPSLNFGLHSLRSGGAAVAAKSHVNERCIKRHGRWKTDFVKDGYIEDTLEKRISVSVKNWVFDIFLLHSNPFLGIFMLAIGNTTYIVFIHAL